MKRRVWPLAILVLIGLVAPRMTMALGPADAEVKVVYWQAEVDDGFLQEDMKGPGAEASFWFFKKLGVTGSLYKTSGSGILDGVDIDFTSLDVKWRLISPTEHNYLAVGLGYQNTDIDSSSTSGVRLLVEGNVGLVGILQGYGRYVYMPDMSDLEGATDGSGTEYEFGVEFKMAVVAFYAGYRAHDLSFNDFGMNADLNTDGFVAGIGFEF